MTLTVGTSGGNKSVATIYVGTSGGNKAVQTGYIGTSGGNKVFFSALEVVATATAGFHSNGGLVTINGSATVTGGSGSYTYLWERVGTSYGLSINDATSRTPVWTKTAADGEEFTETWTCTATDAASGVSAVSNQALLVVVDIGGV